MNKMEFALVFSGRTEGLKAAAQEAKASIASVSNEAGRSAGPVSKHAAALEKDAAAAQKAAAANGTLETQAKRTAASVISMAQVGPYTGLAAAIDGVNVKLGQQAAATDRVAAANRRLAAVNRNGAGSFQTANLAFQAQDMAVQAAMGMQPWMIGLQQGMQAAPIIASMERPVAGVAAAFASLASPITLATVGLTAGSAALIQYFTTAEEGAEKTNALFESQNETIRRAAALWGEATPALKAYADELNRVNGADAGREAGGIIAGRELEQLGGKLEGLRDKAVLAFSALRAQPGTDDTVRTIGYAWDDLRERVHAGTATVADFDQAKRALADGVRQHGTPALVAFSKGVDEITAAFYRSLRSAQNARNEWFAAIAGGTNVQDIVAGSMFTDAGQVYQTDRFTPKNPAIPTRRPLIELEGLPGETKENEATARSYRDVIQGAQDRIAQMQLEAQVSGQTGIAAQSLRFELGLLQDVQEKGRKITPEQRKEIERLGAAYETAARQAASAQLLSNLQFEREQLLRSPIDQRIASQLHGAGLTVDLNSYEAGIIRQNDALRQQAAAWDRVRSTGENAIDTLFGKLSEGDFSGALSEIAKDFSQTIIELAASTPLKHSLTKRGQL